MFEIYETNNKQIPSVKYIYELLKMIESELKNINPDFQGFKTIKSNIENLDGLKSEDDISADRIKTNPRHRFVNEALLTTFVNKPSKFEVEQALTEVKQEIEDTINKTYMRIVNTPNVINKLRDIATILNEDEILNGFANTIANKATIENLKEHEKSSVHMNNNDRKALNILLASTKDGFVDWNAEEGSVNAIKNKPDSLPANGGNAETVCGHRLKNLINKGIEDIVVGTNCSFYSKDSCDICAKDGFIDIERLESEINHINNNGVVLFKRGEYTMESLNAHYYNLPMIFKGADRRLSRIDIVDGAKFFNVTFKHIGFENSTIYIQSAVDLDDVLFDNCDIVLQKSEDCNIRNCVFKNCRIRIEGSIMNNIIVHNRYEKTKPIIYLGSANIISENIGQ